MKALLATLSVIAALGMAVPAFAGPSVGQRGHGQRVISHMHEMRERREQARAYALTGDHVQAREYRWETKLKWVGGHRYRRVVYIRVPVE